METLIINKRHEQPLVKRVLWDTITVLLWIGWIYLWKPLLNVFYQIATLHAPAETISDIIYDEIASVGFEHAVFMLIATPIVLFILARLHRHKSSGMYAVYEPVDYANYFHVNEEELQQCRNTQLVTVYHDAHGQIRKLEDQIKQ